MNALLLKERPTPRFGRAVDSSPKLRRAAARRSHQHNTTNSLRDVILGGQDGLVNMLGIVFGVVAAGGSTHVLIVTGLAAAITESISMGAVARTASPSSSRRCRLPWKMMNRFTP